MAITYGFYNSKDGDRKYYAKQVSKIVDSLVKDGIFMHVGNHLNVKQGTGMQVLVESGFAWFNHTWTENDAEYPLTVEESDLLQPRIDAVILEVDESLAVRANSIKIVKGTPNSEPQKPTLTNTSEIHQYPLAYVSVAVGVTEITNANIENRIGMEDCPFVTGILETISIDTLVQEWEAQFNDWFETLEDILSGDVAANLAAQITEINTRLSGSYKATFTLDGWQESGGTYSQTVMVESRDDGPAITSTSLMTSAITIRDDYPKETYEILKEAGALIDAGTKTFGEGTITCSGLEEKPTADVEVVFQASKGGK